MDYKNTFILYKCLQITQKSNSYSGRVKYTMHLYYEGPVWKTQFYFNPIVIHILNHTFIHAYLIDNDNNKFHW